MGRRWKGEGRDVIVAMCIYSKYGHALHQHFISGRTTAPVQLLPSYVNTTLATLIIIIGVFTKGPNDSVDVLREF